MKLNIPDILTREFPYWNKIEFFKKALYILLFINTLTFLPIAHDLFSYYSLQGSHPWNLNEPIYMQGSAGLLNILSHPATSTRDWVYMFVIAGQLIFLITGFFRIMPVFSAVVVYFCTVNLYIKGGIALTGGEGLLNVVLFYLIFIQKPKTNGFFGELQNILNNTFYWILLIQICVLYLFAGIYKLFDPTWTEGLAVMYVSRIDVFSSWGVSFLRDNYFLSAILTYSVIAYQLLFVFAVWIKRIKIPFLVYGVVFHLMTSFGMGIFAFGWIMVIMYLLFLDDQQIEKLKSFFKRKGKAVQTT